MPSTTIDDLRDARGQFSMLAIDQRGSLRTMLAQGEDLARVSDADLVAFKLEVARSLSGHASAILVDRDYGREAALAADCPVILAADVLTSSVPGGAVDAAELDLGVTSDVARDYRAAALKQLVPWTPDTRDAAIDLSARFMELCRTVGLPGIVEGVVRPVDIATWSDVDRDEAIVTAAADLGGVAPDLYKGEVPSYGRGDHARITAVAERVTAALDCPWVVLSSGVTAHDFPAAVRACEAGGADGFLAGRAIWADAVSAADPAEFLRTVSAERLRAMATG